MRVSNRNQ